MLFLKSRVEEDLEKIRLANLPHENLNEKSNEQEELKLEKNDIPAIILAVLSLILPYFAAFVAIMACVVFLLGYFY
ncbi:hypothetical protein SDC9_54040 [bioreactor metagenome]|jgi:hypothetical protein|uniref:Uncharacterized protein n=2 Tax=root TaxID=1 RepID=A0A562J260_9FIRM|nr:hypothetical protein [Sedimentibacter saalensis]MEA5096108.1 hypothetical protein [Sedimentibacter saalensis]TWH76925.1 hypothetical protein LY60_03553 [Sedimentibacter saalensis]